MTLSPAHQSDTWGVLSPIASELFESTLGICERQTAKNNLDVKRYCEHNELDYIIDAARLSSQCISLSRIQSKGVVLHTRGAILSFTSDVHVLTISAIVCYQTTIISVQCGSSDNAEHIFFVECNKELSVRIEIDKICQTKETCVYIKTRRAHVAHTPCVWIYWNLLWRWMLVCCCGMHIWIKKSTCVFINAKKLPSYTVVAKDANVCLQAWTTGLPISSVLLINRLH